MEQTEMPATEPGGKAAQAAVDVSREQKLEDDSPLAVANSLEAQTLRAEIIRVGRKLWERQYVDGNGGNISVRLGSRYVLCTPTLLSKCDLEPADICLSDLDGKILAGCRLRTSELLLPSALCHGLFHHRHHAPQRPDFGVRNLHRPGGSGAL
jgi:hypothetical protein